MHSNKTYSKGDVLVFNPSQSNLRVEYFAEKNATVLVTNDCYEGHRFVEVKWLDDKANGQQNGGYYKNHFTKLYSVQEENGEFREDLSKTDLEIKNQLKNILKDVRDYPELLEVFEIVAKKYIESKNK
jgi:hypothetical protein